MLLSFRQIFRTVKYKCCFQIGTKFSSFSDLEFKDHPDTDHKKISEFKKYLKSQHMLIKDGYTCFKISCRLCCNKENNSAYVNKTTGIVVCPKCNVKKPLSQVIHLYEKGLKLNENEVDAVLPKFMDSELKDVTQDICDLLQIKGLKALDLKSVGCRYHELHHSLHFPLTDVNNSIIGEKVYQLREGTEESRQGFLCSGILQCGANKSKAILVTNVVDFLVLLSHHFDNYTIVCLPYSLKTLPQEVLPALEKFNELIFWFDFDVPGWDGARKVSQKLNEKRCLLIRPTATEPSPYIAHKKHLNLRHILVKALPVLHKSITTFSELKSEVLSELQNIDKVNGVKWKRYPILNKLLKGHRKGELTILTGPTGSGKTTFMSEYSLDLALQGVSTLWGSFEIRNSRLASTLLRQYVGYSLEKKLNEFDHWANAFEKLPMYFMTFHGQQTIKVVMEAIDHAQYTLDVNHVIIDNLQFMMGVSATYRNDKFWEQDEIIASFRSFATKRNVHVTLVMHPRKEKNEDDLTTSSVFGGAKATQEADNVLIIQDKRLVSVRGKKYLQVVKNRYSGDLGIMPLEFDKEALSYAKRK